MSSPVAVKCEDLQHDEFNVATDESDTDDASIDIDSLQLLDAKFASKSKFPVGCTVWYNAKKSKVTKMLRAKSGCVVGVYFDLQCMRQVYKVKCPIGNESAISEDRLMYGINCPVQVTNRDTNEAVDGVIVVPKIEQTINGKQRVTYAVQYTDGGNVSVEFLVDSDRVKYREDEGKSVDFCSEEVDTKVKKAESDHDVDEKQKAIARHTPPPLPTKMEQSKLEVTLKVEGREDIALGRISSRSEAGENNLVQNINATEYSKFAEVDPLHSQQQEREKIKVKAKQNDTSSTSIVISDGVGRNRAPNEYSALANNNTQSTEQQEKKGLHTSRNETQAMNNKHLSREEYGGKDVKQSSPIAVARWQPPSKGKSPQSRGEDVALKESASSQELKRSFEVEVKSEDTHERPQKMIKTEIKRNKNVDGELKYKLTIPEWVTCIHGRGKRDLFFHLIGDNKAGKSTGYKIQRIRSESSCKVRILDKNNPLEIEIISTSNSLVGLCQGIRMIEESLMDFIGDQNAGKKMLFELSSMATGSHLVEENILKRNDKYRIVLREYDSVKYWCALFELPYLNRGKVKEYHGRFLSNLRKSLSERDCTIELYGDKVGLPLAHTSPFVLIRGKRHKDVKDAVCAVNDSMRKHQGRGCGCTPKWRAVGIADSWTDIVHCDD